jgi:hypothetical protein
MTMGALAGYAGLTGTLLTVAGSGPAYGSLFQWPYQAVPVTEGLLAHVQGGLVTELTLRPRVSVLLGAGSTPREVGRRLAAIMATAGAPSPVPTPNPAQVESAARAFLYYNRFYLSLSGPAPAANWRVGLRLPLPVEVATGGGGWIVNSVQLAEWATDGQGSEVTAVLDTAAAPLTLPDWAAVRVSTRQQAALAQTPPDIQRLAATTVTNLLTNPFDSVASAVRIFQSLREQPVTGAPQLWLALGLVEGLPAHQAELLARLTAGSAVLRAAWHALAAPPPGLDPAVEARRLAAIQRLATAMQLPSAGPGPDQYQPVDTFEPGGVDPTVDRPPPYRETPVEAATEYPGGRHRLALGQDVCTGAMNSLGGFRGPAHNGRINPATLWAGLSRAGLEAQLIARLNVAVRITHNEGWLDAARLRDGAILSVGMHQWSAHTNDEIASLLWRFQAVAPDQYDLFFGLYGLALHLETADPDDPLQAQSVMLRRITRGTGVVDMAPGGPTPPSATRLAFFGGAGTPGSYTFGTEWSARSRIAAIVSDTYRLVQLEVAAYRFTRILRAVPPQTIGTVQYPVEQLFTSELGAGLLLDAHINKPGYVAADVHTAVAAAVALVASPTDPTTGALTATFVQTLARQYQASRRLDHSVERGAWIRNNSGLSAAAGSFDGWRPIPTLGLSALLADRS